MGDDGVFVVRATAGAALFVSLLPFSVNMANADPLPERGARGENVADRPRPDYDAAGMPLGGFTATPSVEVGVGVDSNVFAAPDGETYDVFATVRPRFLIRSNWSRHLLEASAEGEARAYADETGEDRFAAALQANGRLDILRRTAFAAAARYDRRFEDRAALDSPATALEPVEFDVFAASAALSHGVNRLSFRLGAVYEKFDFHDAPQSGGGVIDQDFRDRGAARLTGEAAYEFSPGYSAVLRAETNRTDYDGPAAGAPDRDSNGYRVEAGLAFEATNLLHVEARAGFLQQDYDSPAFTDGTVSGASYAVDILWNPTPLTSFTFESGRRVEDATFTDAAGRFVTYTDASIHHELLRNVILGLEGGFSRSDVEGTARKDDDAFFEASAKYLASRSLYAEAGYRYETRKSSEPLADFSRNIFEVRLGAQR